jgi:methylmalonyl-CoA/ethylmalonyl-CoA epimerase
VQLPLDHVGIAVPSLATAVPLYELLTGASGSPPEHIESQNVTVVFIGQGVGRLELIEPSDPASPIARFLERRGPGLHHIAYTVADIDDTLRGFIDAGFEPIDRTPRAGAHGHRVAFLHPRSTGGVLIELVGE